MGKPVFLSNGDDAQPDAARHLEPGPHRPKALFDLASDVLNARRRRITIFGEDACLLGEPAWDILLDLYVHPATKPVSISSACIASGVPGTTALRWIDHLRRRGLVRRFADPTDKRRNFVALAPRGQLLVEEWLHARIAIAQTKGVTPQPAQPMDEVEWLRFYRSLNEMQMGVVRSFLHLLGSQSVK
ncbi:DNA-binding MarR family transcriptional regulator [Sphingomonas endophytica]|uniref:DNA-binding MarR family transcriptional regulator n=1 Tax=Sphingomonas endophytica TaxID=869719 RepID=A0A7X0J8R9_9SPHN|nr:MarR family transcriptional regulator [Sphingomonas endophytica]MBB6503189.1 DNA-binding MarR family transcriptional regulator [Sphingomonas endophytica]